MNLLQRLKNLWAFSSLSVEDKGDRVSIEKDRLNIMKQKEEEPIKMPIIIKKNTPTQEFLKEK